MQVTENTALILDECGILTTYRGETFVKGRGYVKTYFVPLDDNFNLVKKQTSSEYFRSDIGQYYAARNTMLSDTSAETVSDTVPRNSKYDIRNLSTDNIMYQYDDGNYYESFNRLQRSISYIDSIDNVISIPPIDDLSDSSSEPEVIETRC